jgi:hypothetical protein
VRKPFSCPCSTSFCSSSTSGRVVSTASMDLSFSQRLTEDSRSKRSEPDLSVPAQPFGAGSYTSVSTLGRRSSILD